MTQEKKQEHDTVELWLNRVERITSFLKAGFVYTGSTIGLFTAGLTPALTFGYSLYHALSGIEGWSSAFAKGAGFSLAVTMEVVGSISAYVAQKSINAWHKLFAGLILLAYTGIGLGYMYQFEQNETVRNISFVGYLVSLLVYIVVPLFTSTIEAGKDKAQEDSQSKQIALQADLEAKEEKRLVNETKQKQDEQDRLFELRKQETQLKWQHEEAQRQAEREHEAKMLALKLEAETKLAKVNAGKKVETSRKDSSNLPETYQETYTDYRLVPENVRRTFLSLTVEEIADLYNLSRKTAGNWKKRAIESFSQVSVNGNGVHRG